MPLSDFPEFDGSNPTSLYSLMPVWLKPYCDNLTDEDFAKTDVELSEELFADDTIPEMPYRLRIAFWDEYDRVIRYGEPMMLLDNVYNGICHLTRFRKEIGNPKYFAWLLKPPTGYTLLLKEMSQLALQRQLEVMRLPITDSKGRPNVKLIEAQHKIFQHLDTRLKGAVVQKIEQKNLNVSIDGNTKSLAPARQLTLDEVNKELERLRKVSESLSAPVNAALDPQKMITGETMDAEVIRENPTEAYQPKDRSDSI